MECQHFVKRCASLEQFDEVEYQTDVRFVPEKSGMSKVKKGSVGWLKRELEFFDDDDPVWIIVERVQKGRKGALKSRLQSVLDDEQFGLVLVPESQRTTKKRDAIS